MKWLMVVFVLMFVIQLSSFAGVAITIENDVFLKTDNNYSHGTEVMWIDEHPDGEIFRIGYGIKQLMFTPTEITIKENQSNERPWCGTLSVFLETTGIYKEELVRNRFEVGVLGPSSGAEFSQKTVHRLLPGNDIPEGWDNQMPDEIMINWYHERYHPLISLGKERSFQSKLEAVYGGTIGTTYINGLGGVLLKVGYNIPALSLIPGIAPKAMLSDFFIYMMVEADGMAVLHNSTIGSSFLRDRDKDHERDLENIVGTYRYGFVVGVSKFSLSYLIGKRTNEFKGETDGGMDWGMVRLEFSTQF